jgi:signal transduction histidine kinase
MGMRCILVSITLGVWLLAPVRATAADSAAPTSGSVAPASDVSAARQLLAIAAEQRGTDLRLARATAERALAAARQARQRTDELRALALLAELAHRHGDYTASLRYGHEGLAVAAATDADAMRVEILTTLAATHRAIGDLPKALELLLQALPIAERTGSRLLLAGVYTELHRSSTNAEPARLDYARKALEALEGTGEEARIALALNNLGNVHRERGETAQARELFERSLALKLKVGDKRSLAIAYHNLSDLADDEHRPEKALALMRQSHALRREVGDTRGVAIALFNIARLLNTLGRPAEALAAAEEAQAIASKLDAPQLRFNVLQTLASTHEALGNYKAALLAERGAREAREKVLNDQVQDRLAELQTRLDVERKEREIELLKRDGAVRTAELQAKESALAAAADRAARAHVERNMVVGGLLLSLIAAGTWISRQQLKRRAAQRILAETQRAREAAEQANALKTRLLHMASHDLKAPLGAIISLATTLRTAPVGAPPPGEMAGWIEGESRRLFGFVNDLLDTAAIEAGRLELQRAPCDFAALAHEVATALDVVAQPKQQRIVFADDTAGAGRVDGDAARLRQVLENILGNALKFTPAGGTVRVSVTRGDGCVRCAVRDEGPGLTPDERSHLFRRFERLSAKPTGGESSTGLGLAIAHEIVTLHGGKIWAESEPGRGATFFVELPA